MAAKLRRVSLLGAFEIQADGGEPPMRDGLILGSRREALGFVIETSRESIEHIVSLAAPPRPGVPSRLTAGIGVALEELGCELLRVELVPLPMEDGDEREGYGAFVQGYLIFRPEGKKSRRLAITATEGIQIALREGLSMMASLDLLQLDVAQLLQDMDQMQTAHMREERKFHSFLKGVTATDFQRFYEQNNNADGERDIQADDDDSDQTPGNDPG